MQNFIEFDKSTLCEDKDLALNILGIIKTYNGSAPVDIEDDYVSTTVPSKEQLDNILNALPADVEYDVLVTSLDSDFDETKIVQVSDGGDEQEDEEYEIDEDDLDGYTSVFDLIIYTYNMEDISEDQLDEIKRVIKVNSRGKRRIKMKCKKGYKFDGRKCVKISGKELVNKRRGIRKAVRTKRSKGSGYAKRSARLRKKAVKKRRNMGLK